MAEADARRGQNLRALIEASPKFVSWAQLGRQANVTPAAMKAWATGAVPSVGNLLDVAEALERPATDLMAAWAGVPVGPSGLERIADEISLLRTVLEKAGAGGQPRRVAQVAITEAQAGSAVVPEEDPPFAPGVASRLDRPEP